MKLTFPKAKKILGFSFVFGEDFNFFVATNIQIDLYDISLTKQRAKVIKSISFSIADNFAQLYYDSLANIAVICDTQKGTVQPFFLNLYKSRGYKGKTIQLDAESQNTTSTDDESVQGSRA